jgi:Recombination endonuclease VII
MVFISKNPSRKCKWCDNDARIHRTKEGRNKGYYRTCGRKKCLKKQYIDSHICGLKGKSVKKINHICFCCGNEFISESANHKRFCKECAPDKAWRGRAQRYRIGKKQWDELLKAQNFTCALCDRNPETVDHCHKLQKIRGLLCNSCNLSIAAFDKDDIWINKALIYTGVKYAPI